MMGTSITAFRIYCTEEIRRFGRQRLGEEGTVYEIVQVHMLGRVLRVTNVRTWIAGSEMKEEAKA